MPERCLPAGSLWEERARAAPMEVKVSVVLAELYDYYES